jgi:hypothetical protein
MFMKRPNNREIGLGLMVLNKKKGGRRDRIIVIKKAEEGYLQPAAYAE